MTAKTSPATSPATPATAALSLIDELGFAPTRPAAPAKPAKPATARDYVRTVDLAIIMAAGDLVDDLVPEQFREDVRQLVSNQLHHLSTPKAGWPSATLPTPDRSDWR